MVWKEILRQTIHLSLGLAFVWLYHLSALQPVHLYYILLLLLALSFLAKKFRILWPVIQMLEREEDLDFPGRGPIYLVLGMLISMKVFPKDIALASMSVLAVGDAFSHLYGEVFGRILFRSLNGRKRIEGTVAGILLSLPFAYYFAGVLGIAGAVAGMLAELADIEMFGKPVNDNLSVPLVAGSTMLMLRPALGG